MTLPALNPGEEDARDVSIMAAARQVMISMRGGSLQAGGQGSLLFLAFSSSILYITSEMVGTQLSFLLYSEH